MICCALAHALLLIMGDDINALVPKQLAGK